MPTKKKARERGLRSVYEQPKKSSFGRKTVRTIYDRTDDNTREIKKEKDKKKEKKTRPDVRVKGASAGFTTVFRPNGFYHGTQIEFSLHRHPTSFVAGPYGSDRGFGNTPSPKYTEDEKQGWGEGWGNPLVNPKRDCVYMVRARVDQLRADPMIGGFKLEWSWPSGWQPVDGLKKVQLVEAASNPLYVTRLFKSPATAIESGTRFRCRIKAWYP